MVKDIGTRIGTRIGDKILNIVIFIVLVIYLSGYFKIRYFSLIPTISIYPDNDIEVLEVKTLVNQNNQYYIQLFKKTDGTVKMHLRK